MEFGVIHGFADFCAMLRQAGFSMASGDEGIFSLAHFFGPQIAWHTGDGETDPWQWRIRALTECDDIAYAKLFFKKGGWITKEWYPYFLAARRGGKTFEQWYRDGLVGNLEYRAYQCIEQAGSLPLHELKSLMGCPGKEGAKLEAALTKLQGRMFLTICGEARKRSQTGEPYGWPATVLCTADRFFGPEVIDTAQALDPKEAADAICGRVLQLAPHAQDRQIKKFIAG